MSVTGDRPAADWAGTARTDWTDGPPPADQVWLDAYAARTCPVKTHNLYDPTVPAATWQPDTSLQQLFNGGDGFETHILERLIRESGLRAVDLRLLADQPVVIQQAAAGRAVADGAELVVGARLPPDRSRGRVGSVDLLIRGADRPDGRPGYHAAEIKWHKLHERRTLTGTRRPNTSLLLAEIDRPLLAQALRKWGYGFRVGSRETDLLQVAHYQRMLEAAGWSAPGPPRAMLVGTDDWSGRTLVSWVDLDEPLLRGYAARSELDTESTTESDTDQTSEQAVEQIRQGWQPQSALQRYDREFAFRQQVARVARQQAEPRPPMPLVSPVVVKECAHCEWWSHCRSGLDDDDISLRIGTGALDVREVSTLRAHGITTVHDLAATDLSDLESWYLPDVGHRSSAADRLRAAARRAGMLVDEVDFVRLADGPIEVPCFAQEIDFDIETSADGRVYLWGFLLSRPDGREEYRSFARFDDLDDDAERSLAAEALGWLRRQVEVSDGPTGVFHYSEFEVNHLHRLSEQSDRSEPGDPWRELFDWADAFATGSLPGPATGTGAGTTEDGSDRGGFVDLLTVVKDHFFGARGLGLKAVASSGAGFRWRDEDPGGLNSQRWFLDAVHADTDDQRRRARDRVLAYNEDDVLATARVRAWLRHQS